MRHLVNIVVVWLLLPVAGSLAGAEPENGWAGQRVITRAGTELKAAPEDTAGAAQPARPGSRAHRLVKIYRVARTEGAWLRLVPDAWGPSGWVKASEVVAYASAIDHLTGELAAHPSDARAYLDRAIIWRDQRDYDKALTDANDAIRLDPGDAAAFDQRGYVCYLKNAYDKAIADYDEAIRLDPGYSRTACEFPGEGNHTGGHTRRRPADRRAGSRGRRRTGGCSARRRVSAARSPRRPRTGRRPAAKRPGRTARNGRPGASECRTAAPSAGAGPRRRRPARRAAAGSPARAAVGSSAAGKWKRERGGAGTCAARSRRRGGGP